MLQDNFGRQFYYLRLSITDVCNFKCDYCLPDGYQKPDTPTPELSLSEIGDIARAFAALGTKKIRITGGEPALRKDLPDIIELCKSTPGIESVAITTNGYRLPQYIDSWVNAGLDRLNVSIDSLDPKMFQAITGHDRLQEIMQGIKQAETIGLSSIKVNTVLMKQFNGHQLQQYLNWIKHQPITLRFIELMQTGDNLTFFNDNHIAGSGIKQQLLEQGWSPILRSKSAGPAEEFQHPDYQGRVGLIMPYSKDFCDSCNRLRVSSSGQLHLCLFGEQGLPLRHLCQHDDPEALQQQIIEYVKQKKVSHFLQQGETGATKHLAMIGG